ncbi:hypothetical protein B1992_04745 [Pseudoxanthomonas broegbernensis]|uniref:Uncharacterized protein n=1 Tax=Pseudoxanthomonas broegbernensis TaxID=83619 RepID=A0A7V8K888_9GAMM|nr:hypothetical protein [Pseudoxanthomonas broegbernensis]KAF1687401.1 hypothetical protein B1992_04745 [Pseudoxanthomonas broegbernensis]
MVAIAVPLRAQPAPPDRPERERPVGTPQAVGAVHTLRQIPEACTRLEGEFTGQAAQPYRLRAVPAAVSCQPRARYLDAAQARPSAAAGWVLNDVIRVPDAACPSRQAVVRVWRQPAAGPAPARDGQGQARIYLEQARQQAAAGDIAALPRFSAQLATEGPACPP